ncbi:MAG: transglutaminase family protein, partial [Gammaproteobacteria bacterium]|nr:transglutaminase family protein [Gammaproteobacteria bacterium]
AGWIGLDPTSGLFASEGHIPLSCTPDPVSAAPVTGSTEKCEVEFFHSNEVVRIHEDPRVTLPYTETQWAAVDTLAEQVDNELQQSDVRLTMGGEPTFVSIDDSESGQWNTEALGAHKRALAGRLLLRLRDRFGAGGLLHYGQGKWYPGEPVPRWALGCFWRLDGTPVWRNPALLANDAAEYQTSTEQAREFAQALARHLSIPARYIRTAFEDSLYYLWKEGACPANLDPQKANLKDPRERQTLARVLARGLSEPAGFVIPLKWDYASSNWQSAYWELRRGELYLVPGDSPLGFRLPLDSLPWLAPAKREPSEPQSQFQQLPELSDFHGEVAQRFSRLEPVIDPHPEIHEQDYADLSMPAVGTDDEDVLRDIPHTALCIEVREGILHVFMPPCTHLEHYLDLVAAIELTAENLAIPVRLEGYTPPKDSRIDQFQITPDPGVIEVNIHPARSWQELENNTHILYEEARLVRLGTEKFMLDGRHGGTGGGNHVTLGGPTPSDSPLLRRPDLLRSLVSYWQNHPGLSYLFSGLFIGPTSQAPRVDEARDDNLYELEIALDRLPEGETDKPWLVDRVLRNFLVDLTGNTHRSEFCIDKLYSPDSAGGRRGLVELRAFEMPPHPHMSVAQMLLIRALVARFWKQPYRAPLIRWGTDLHDRFMLRHFVWQDFQDVLRGLNRAGYRFEEAWYLPFLEFRFPFIGRLEARGISVELHAALEPWHVLGEESSGQGTARYVDSSVERLQVLVRGLPGDRYAVACNGRHVPLHPTGEQGTYVAGVRYKAWNPPSSLHPTIDVHGPLVFDLVDQGNARSIAGGTYHVSHPGGRNYDTFPLNANEAEARRGARFIAHGGTQGRLRLEPRQPHPDLPFTLDLRRGGG